MASKKQVLKFIDMYSAKIINALDLNHCSIKWFVLNSKEKDLAKKYGFDPNYPKSNDGWTGGVAQTSWQPKKRSARAFSILIYHDRTFSNKDIIGTIYHELLHVRLQQWDSLIKKSKEHKRIEIEEKFICDLEKIIVDLI